MARKGGLGRNEAEAKRRADNNNDKKKRRDEVVGKRLRAESRRGVGGSGK